MYLLGYRYIGNDDTDRREILHDVTVTYRCRTQSFLFGAVPQEIPKIQNFWRLKSDYLENGKSQRYMSIKA